MRRSDKPSSCSGACRLVSGKSLNVESGLNDGICVPLFFIVLAIAQAEETHSRME